MIAVNYYLACHLLKLREAKFIIVISEKTFSDLASTGFRDSIDEFLNLFNFDSMSEQ